MKMKSLKKWDLKRVYHFSKEKENKKSKSNEISKKVYHFSERSRLTRYASTNTAMIHFSSRQKPQNSKITNKAKNTIIGQKRHRLKIFCSSRRHQTLSQRGSSRETISPNPTNSPSPPAAHLLTPSPSVAAANLWISQSVLYSQSANQFLVVSLNFRQIWFRVNSVC